MIDETTDSLIKLIEDRFPPGVLKEVGKLDGRLDDAMLKRFLIKQPAVYFTFVGGRSTTASDVFRIDANWVAYIVTGSRQHEISPEQIISALAPLLNGHTIKGVGTIFCNRVENLFSISKDRKAARIHAISLTIPNYSFGYEADMSDLENFITYHAEHSLTEGDAEPAAIDEITLPQ